MCFKNIREQNIFGFNFPFLKENQRQIKRIECKEYCDQLDIAIGAANSYLEHSNVFVDVTTSEAWINLYSPLRDKLTSNAIETYKHTEGYDLLCEKNRLFNSIFYTLKEDIIEHDDKLARKLIPHGYEMVCEVEGKRPDRQQMISIIKPSKNHLIIAGAGTGKTTTIIGKVKYLLRENTYNPEDFVILSFTNASASEMKERVMKETQENIEVSTFHKLGLNIINAVEGKIPKIYSSSLTSFIIDRLK